MNTQIHLVTSVALTLVCVSRAVNPLLWLLPCYFFCLPEAVNRLMRHLNGMDETLVKWCYRVAVEWDWVDCR